MHLSPEKLIHLNNNNNKCLKMTLNFSELFNTIVYSNCLNNYHNNYSFYSIL